MRWLNFTTFDIIGDLVFSESFHALETSSYHEWMISVFGAMKVIVAIQSANAYPILRFVLQALLDNIPAVQRARARTKQDTRDKVMRRLESKGDHKDFMRYICFSFLVLQIHCPDILQSYPST